MLIKTHRTLVSLGTEKMLVDFGKANYIQKVRQQPDKVKQVLQKVKTDGFRPTLDAVFRKLGEPLPLGYCNAGEVMAVGHGVQDFSVGDRVVSNGPHAEIVLVPRNLVAKIPDEVTFDEAVFTVIGSIALQGIRLLNPTFGETVVVTGLGLIGLIATQLLQANGCKVIGFDFDRAKVELARSWGVSAFEVAGMDVVSQVQNMTGNMGADAILITASSKSDDIMAQAAQMSRKRGRIVLVGVVGLNLKRSDFYEKEISFQVSCSYGPGRYDAEYEDKGHDYPAAYVRWTEKRNFDAILEALRTKKLLTQALVTEKVPLDEYQQIYGDMSKPGSIASIIEYEADKDLSATVLVNERSFSGSTGVVGVIGAGNFASSMIIPTLAKLKTHIKYIASAKGLSATTLAKKYGIGQSTTDVKVVLDDPEIDAVLITTRHDQHADLLIQGLKHDKHVFVEKPLAISREELDRIEKAMAASNKIVTVGFNRRFSPFALKAKELLGTDSKPINVVATVNAGFVPADHWVQDMEIGGGRIVGEACHFIDLITFLCGSHIQSVVMNALGPDRNTNTDNASILLQYQNGTQGVINYFSNGHKSYPKERIEIYDQGKTMIIDNFREAKFYGYRQRKMRRAQDKGHKEQFRRWQQWLTDGGSPIISTADLINTSRTALACIESLQTKEWTQVD